MSIAPIVKSVRVKAPPERAFELFTGSMHKWWGKGVGERPFVAIVIEPRVGGRWYERDDQGNETQWGAVTLWSPPGRVLLAWQLNTRWKFDPDFSTELEIRFEAAPGGGTVVTLEHRQLERYGDEAQRHSDALRGGWPGKMESFAAFTDSETGDV